MRFQYLLEDILGIDLKCSMLGLDTSWAVGKYAVAAGSAKHSEHVFLSVLSLNLCFEQLYPIMDKSMSFQADTFYPNDTAHFWFMSFLYLSCMR